MTHAALADLTLAEVRARGAEAHCMGLPYLSGNPFTMDASIESFEAHADKCRAWYVGWLEADRGRTESVRQHLRAELV